MSSLIRPFSAFVSFARGAVARFCVHKTIQSRFVVLRNPTLNGYLRPAGNINDLFERVAFLLQKHGLDANVFLAL